MGRINKCIIICGICCGICSQSRNIEFSYLNARTSAYTVIQNYVNNTAIIDMNTVVSSKTGKNVNCCKSFSYFLQKFNWKMWLPEKTTQWFYNKGCETKIIVQNHRKQFEEKLEYSHSLVTFKIRETASGQIQT